MERLWYLARDGQIFGPVNDTQLSQAATTGRVLPTDQLNIAGQPNWWLASAIPGLLPVPAEPALIPATVVSQAVRVTCLACFREVTVEAAEGQTSAHCPKCRAAITLAEPAKDAANPNQAAFAKLESKKDFKKRMQKKVADAQAAAAADAAIAGGIIGAIIAAGD